MVHLTVFKLDSATRRAWETLIGAETEFPTFDQLQGFLNTRINTLEALESQQTPSRSTGFSNGARSFKRSHHAASFRESTCALCSSNHFIMNCKDFRAKTPDQRRERVKKKNSISTVWGLIQ